MSTARAWLQALRPLAQANLATPLLCGAALGWSIHATDATPHPLVFAGLGLLFTLSAQPCIVFLNDLHDADGDALHTSPTIVSGGSRVLVEGKIRRASLQRALYLCTGIFFGVSLCIAVLFDRPFAPAFAATTCVLSWFYSAPPVRGCTTRLGLWLQAIGTGMVLAIFGAYLQTGTLDALPFRAVV